VEDVRERDSGRNTDNQWKGGTQELKVGNITRRVINAEEGERK